jgi:chitinase
MGHVRNIGVRVLAFLFLLPSLCAASSLLVSWKASSDSDLAGYKVYYGTQSGMYGSVVAVQNTNSYKISNVQSGSTYYVAVTAYDNSGNESSRSTEISAYIPVAVTDTTAPTGSVMINSGASSTTTSTVTITLSANDAGGAVTGMKISNDGVIYSTEYVYTTSSAWTLSSGYGTKTVYVLFKDAAGNWMTSPVTDTIQVTDITAPAGSVMINAGEDATTTSAVILSLGANDAGGTVTGMKISNDGVIYSTEYVYTTSCAWTLSSGYGNKTVYVLFKDAAGNWMTSPATGTIQVISAIPASTGSVVINPGVSTPEASAVTQNTGTADASGTEAVTSLIKPVIISPENMAIEVPLRPVLKTTTLANNHRLTEWEISNDKGDVLLDLKSSTQLTKLVVPELILDAAMKHYCRVKFYDDQNNETQWSDPVAFETVNIDPADLNKNGIPDDQELLSGEDVDLDNDGVADRDQDTMKALVTVEGQEYISLKMSTNCKGIRYVTSIDSDSIHDTVGKPGALPIGLINFKVEVVNPGDFAEVVVNLSEPAPQGAKWFMYDETNGWRVYPYCAFSDDRMKVTIQLKDGDPEYGDTDGVANGIIIDPSGIGVGEQQTNAETSSGCYIETSMHDPSSQGLWAARVLMGLILALFAGIDRYRKKIDL